MNANREANVVPQEKPVSVYKVNFGREILTDEEREFLTKRTHSRKHAIVLPPARIKRSDVKRGGALIIAGIFAIALLHFGMQIKFIRGEKAAIEKRVRPAAIAVEAPAITETIPQVIDPEPEVNAADGPVRTKYAPPSRPRSSAPVRNSSQRRRDRSVTESERLRRAEKILTGV